MNKIKTIIYVILISLIVFNNISLAEDSLFNKISQQLINFINNNDILIQSTYSNIAETDSPIFSEIGLTLGIINHKTLIGGQVSFYPNSFQAGIRQYFIEPHVFDDNRLYIEPVFSRKSNPNFVSNTYGGYMGILFPRFIALDLAMGYEVSAQYLGVNHKIKYLKLYSFS